MKKSSKRTLKSKNKSYKKSKSVPKRKVNKKNTKGKKRSAVKNNKTNKQKGGSQVGKNYDEGCYQLTKKTCGKNNECMWLGTNKCVVKEKKCSICLQSIFNLTKEKGKTVSKQVLDLVAPNNCNHVFCIDCAQSLNKSTKKCPMCRTDFDHFNNVSIDKNNVLVRSSEKIKINIWSNDSVSDLDDSDSDSYYLDPEDEDLPFEILLTTTPRQGVSITEEDVKRTFPMISNDELKDYLTMEPNTERYGDTPGNRAYVQEILVNILLLWRDFFKPRRNLHNRFKNLIGTSFNLNRNQLNSLLSRGDGVNDNITNRVFEFYVEDVDEDEDEVNDHITNRVIDRSGVYPVPYWYLEVDNNQYPRDANIDDLNEDVFRILQRYIDEYKRVSIFET